MSTIYVSIVSPYCDDVFYTVEDLFKKAKYPKSLKVFVNVCEAQGSEGYLLEQYTDSNVVTVTWNADSMLVSQMTLANMEHFAHEEEGFYLQIRPHQRFVLHWDTICLCMINQCFKSEYTEHNKALLTTFPTSAAVCENDVEVIEDNVPHVHEFDYIENGLLHTKSVPMNKYKVRRTPKRTHLLCSDFVFAPVKWCKVGKPFHLACVADESIISSVASFVQGWEIFNSYEVLCYMDYSNLCDEVGVPCQDAIQQQLEHYEVSRCFDSYAAFSGYDVIKNDFVAKSMTNVSDTAMWKNIYQKATNVDHVQFIANREKSNVVIVSVRPSAAASANHSMFAKISACSHAKVVLQETTVDDIVLALNAYRTIVLIRGNCIFSTLTKNWRFYTHTLFPNLSTTSYCCKSGCLDVIGPSRQTNMVYNDYCIHSLHHVFRRDYFMYHDMEHAEQVLSAYNKKYLKV